MTNKQTLDAALHLGRTGKSATLAMAMGRLNGLPEGGWPETVAAKRDIEDWLPGRWQRSYSVEEFIASAYRLEEVASDAARVYRTTETETEN